MTDRRRFLKRLCLGTAGVAALGASAHTVNSFAGEMEQASEETTGSPAASDAQTATPTPAGSDAIGTGVYLGDESALADWEEWFGCQVDIYAMNVPRGSWADYRIQNMPLEVPIADIAADRELAVTFTMFPPGRTDMAAVADGDHGDRYRRLGRDFIERGISDVSFRFGAELNGDWSVDGAVGRPDRYKRAWRRVVDAMNGVEGSEFSFVWAPNVGEKQLPPPEAYPGDEYVDNVGLTFYDSGHFYYPFPEDCDAECRYQRRRNNWERLVNQEYGLDFWANFAEDHDKPLVFPEYGIRSQGDDLYGGGDNPDFFRWFHEWMAENDAVVDWHVVWSWVNGPQFVGPEDAFVNDDYTRHPEASTAFKCLFGCSDVSATTSNTPGQ